MSKCLICGETRGIQDCHIIGKAFDSLMEKYRIGGKSISEENILRLCPNHHWYFDSGKLSPGEWEKIRDQVENSIANFLLAIDTDRVKTMELAKKHGFDLKDLHVDTVKHYVLRNRTLKNMFGKAFNELCFKVG